VSNKNIFLNENTTKQNIWDIVKAILRGRLKK
jgi:hypothetical protein